MSCWKIVCRCALRAWVLLVLAPASGCSMSREQEIQLGLQARPQFEQEFGGLVKDPQLQEYVQNVGESLINYTDRPSLPWEFRVLESDQLNAFALPGGFVYLTEGLLSKLDNEAQLAAILAHEAGHVANRHSVQQLQRTQLVQGGFLLAGLLGGEQAAKYSDVGQLVAGLALLKYTRGQERKADLAGLRYLYRRGYDPSAMVEVMQVFEQHAQQSGGDPPEFLSSHPSPGNRQEYLREAIEEDYSHVLANRQRNDERFRRMVVGAARPAALPQPRTEGAALRP